MSEIYEARTEPEQGSGSRAWGRSVAVRRDNRGLVSTGDNATITTHDHRKRLRVSIPVFGPLIATHPVAAGVAAVVVVSGTAVGGASLAGSSSGGAPSLAVQRQVVLQVSTPEKPVGYDFSTTRPTLTTGQNPAIYLEGSTLMASNGRIGQLTSGAIPTRASDCQPAFVGDGGDGQTGNRPYAAQVGNVICYVDGAGRTGYLLVTGYTETTLTIDTAHLPAG